MAPLAVPAEMAVSLSQFLSAVRQLRGMPSGGRMARAHLRPAAFGVRLEAGGLTRVIDGEGVWRVDATISRRQLLRLGDLPPSQDPLGLRVSGRRLFVGEAALPCRWQLSTRSLLELPARPSVAELAAIADGLELGAVEDPELRLALAGARDQLREAVNAAAEALAPFGVGEFDLRMLLRRKLRQGGPRAFHPVQRELFPIAEPKKRRGPAAAGGAAVDGAGAGRGTAGGPEGDDE